MMNEYTRAFCRPSLIIFVDATGYNIFQELKAIKNTVGLDEPLQKNIGLIFYQSKSGKVWSGLFDTDIHFDDQNSYTSILEEAINDMLNVHLKNEDTKNTHNTGSFDFQLEPQIYIVGNSNTPAPGIVLKMVHASLARPNRAITGATVYYVLSRHSDRFRVNNPQDENAALNDWSLRETVNFCYLYPSTATSPKKAYYAAASALFILTSTDITSQQAFQYIVQPPSHLSGTMCTCLLTFPSQEVKRYYQCLLTSDLLTRWIIENNALVTLPNPADATELALSSVAPVIEPEPPAMEITQMAQKIQQQLLLYPETRTLTRFFTLKDINKLYSEACKQNDGNNSAVTWTAFLEEQLEAQKSEAQKDVLANVLLEMTNTIWQQPPRDRRIGSARAAIEVFRQKLAHLFPNQTQSDTNTAILSQGVPSQGTKDMELLRKEVDQAMGRLPSRPSLGVAAFLALGVLCFLILTQLSSLIETLAIVIVPVVILTVGYFVWHQQKITRAQKRLLKRIYQNTLGQANASENIQKRQIIESLLQMLSKHLDAIQTWLKKVQSEFQQEADKEYRKVLNELAASPHIHICNRNLLRKDMSDGAILKQYYVELILRKINEQESRGMRDTQLSLYKQLFALPQERVISSVAENGKNEQPPPQADREANLRKELSAFIEPIIDEHLGKTPEFATEFKIALENKEVWHHLFDTLLRPSTADTSVPSLTFICGYRPDPKEIQKCIQEIDRYQQLEILPVRIRNEHWFFVASFFRDGSPPPLNPDLFPRREIPNPLNTLREPG